MSVKYLPQEGQEYNPVLYPDFSIVTGVRYLTGIEYSAVLVVDF